VIEFGLFHNGGGDLPTKYIPEEDIYLVDGTIEDVMEQSRRTIPAQVRQGILAEQLGFDAWIQTEHHFQPEGVEMSPNPLIVEAAIASRTKRIRIQQAANIISWHHPLRLAEQVAMLDIISGGRVDFGIARGYQPREAEVFGQMYGSSIQDQERNRAYFEEAYDIIIKAWTEPSFNHQGAFYSIPAPWTRWNHKITRSFFQQPGVERTSDQVLNEGVGDEYGGGSPINSNTTTLRELSVVPQPLQRPHPQVFMGVGSTRSIEFAAERGINGHYPAYPSALLRKGADAYQSAAEKAGWPDMLDRGEFKYGWDCEKRRGLVVQNYFHIYDPKHGIGDKTRFDQSLRALWDFLSPFGFSALVPNADGSPRDPKQPVVAEDLYRVGTARCGTPEELCEQILETKRGAGFEDYFYVIELAFSGFEHAEIEEQMHVFAEEIMPVLRRECGGGPDRYTVEVDLDVGDNVIPDPPVRVATT
jgi:alkanesulfonate monooxygenase SsuD/methylene tetrahydromethanopterin reductase-like flavin-dependent oxidoreductase (luciferase family)